MPLEKQICRYGGDGLTLQARMETELKSTDYARLVQFTSQKMHMTILNKTQVNKILFYVYGVYLAETGKPLFADDTPKAWTFGPVFPIPNKRLVPGEVIRQSSFTDQQIKAFKDDGIALGLVARAVGRMYNVSAIALTEWSHQEGSPWYDTIYKKEGGKVVEQRPWNTPIPLDMIASYFKNPQNRIFG